MDFGIILRPKLDPKSEKNRFQNHQKSNQKICWVFNSFYTDFYRFGLHFGKVSDLQNAFPNFLGGLFEGSWCLLGPRWPPDLSKRAPKTDFGLQIRAKMAPDPPTWSQNGFQDLQHGAKMDLKDHKLGPNLAPTWPT